MGFKAWHMMTQIFQMFTIFHHIYHFFFMNFDLDFYMMDFTIHPPLGGDPLRFHPARPLPGDTSRGNRPWKIRGQGLDNGQVEKHRKFPVSWYHWKKHGKNMEHPQSFHGRIMKTYGKTHTCFSDGNIISKCVGLCVMFMEFPARF